MRSAPAPGSHRPAGRVHVDPPASARSIASLATASVARRVGHEVRSRQPLDPLPLRHLHEAREPLRVPGRVERASRPEADARDEEGGGSLHREGPPAVRDGAPGGGRYRLREPSSPGGEPREVEAGGGPVAERADGLFEIGTASPRHGPDGVFEIGAESPRHGPDGVSPLARAAQPRPRHVRLEIGEEVPRPAPAGLDDAGRSPGSPASTSFTARARSRQHHVEGRGDARSACDERRAVRRPRPDRAVRGEHDEGVERPPPRQTPGETPEGSLGRVRRIDEDEPLRCAHPDLGGGRG